MAKSSSFFSLRSGSTKSHTYQVLNGVQITKDRVTQVANPRTTAQLKQRIATATASQMYAQLKRIVNHSFEGVGYGAPSMRYFLSGAVKAAQDIISASTEPSAASVKATLSWYKNKNAVCVPAKISEGSLATNCYAAYFEGTKEATPVQYTQSVGYDFEGGFADLSADDAGSLAPVTLANAAEASQVGALKKWFAAIGVPVGGYATIWGVGDIIPGGSSLAPAQGVLMANRLHYTEALSAMADDAAFTASDLRSLLAIEAVGLGNDAANVVVRTKADEGSVYFFITCVWPTDFLAQGIGFIVSKDGSEHLRSTSYAQPLVEGNYLLALASYPGQSDLFLDGGNI